MKQDLYILNIVYHSITFGLSYCTRIYVVVDSGGVVIIEWIDSGIFAFLSCGFWYIYLILLKCVTGFVV